MRFIPAIERQNSTCVLHKPASAIYNIMPITVKSFGSRMNQSNENNTNSAKKSGAERWIKLAFLAALIMGAFAVWWVQRSGTTLKGWGRDLEAALQTARQEDRPVLALFVSDPPGTTKRWLKNDIISKQANRKAVRKGKFIPVEVALETSLDSETAKRFRVRKLPTLMVIGPDGRERNRREGKVGEMEFRNGFLDCTEVMSPEGG